MPTRALIQSPADVLALDWADLDRALRDSSHFQATKSYVADHKYFKPGRHGDVAVDADTGNFFARQLEYVSRTIRSELFAPKKFRSLIPFNVDQPGNAAESYTYYQEKRAGVAKPGTSYSNQAPRVEVGTDGPFTSPIKPLTAAYGYTLQEIRAAQMANMNLPVRKGLVVREVIEFGLNDVAIFGDSALKIPGFLTSLAGVPIAEVAADGGDKTFAAKIAAGKKLAVLADLNAWANAVVEQSAGRIIPTTILLPLAQFNLISSTPMSSDNSKSILRTFLENSPYVREVDWLPELKTAGTYIGQAGDVAICYERAPSTVSQIVPVDYEELPPEARGFETVINSHARTGGTNWERPLGGKFFYGI